MTRARYFQWMAIFEWLQGHKDRTGRLGPLFDHLNEMLQEDRKTCTEDQLAAYAAAWASGNIDIDIEKDPQFQAFMGEMNRAFRDRQ